MAPIQAIIWDFDNTLVDTGARNLSVTRSIVTRITGRAPDEFPMLRNRAAYDRALHRTQDWREFYAGEFGMEPDEIWQAGRLWTEVQLADATPVSWFPGVVEAITRLGRWPHGIVSLNTRANIESHLAGARLSHVFETVVGCGEVPHDRQKPSPEGLLACVESLTGDAPGTVVYIGDHAVDAECARNANRAYARAGREVRVVSIAASYGAAIADAGWPVEAHHRAGTPADVLHIVEALAD